LILLCATPSISIGRRVGRSDGVREMISCHFNWFVLAEHDTRSLIKRQKLITLITTYYRNTNVRQSYLIFMRAPGRKRVENIYFYVLLYIKRSLFITSLFIFSAWGKIIRSFVLNNNPVARRHSNEITAVSLLRFSERRRN
jgi:hypothetical protein